MDTRILSQIRIVESDRILCYEWPHEDKADDIDLNDVFLIRHPFLAVPLKNDNFLILEDAPYFHALVKAGLTHIPIQVCLPDEIDLRPAHLGLTGFTFKDLVRTSARFSDQIIIGQKNGEFNNSDEFIRAAISFNDRKPISVFLRHSSKVGCPQSLEFLFRAIETMGRYQPLAYRVNTVSCITRPASLSAVIDLPAFTIDDIKAAAFSEKYFPPCTLQVSVASRILNIDFPVEILNSENLPEEKEAYLRDLMLFRAQSQRTVFYEGKVYLFNR